MTLTLRSALAALTLATGICAQGSKDVEKQFAQARLAAEVQNDFVAAARLYAGIAESAKASKSDRTRAWLELANTRIKLGQPDGARDALAKAAAGEGPAAAEAKRRQNGGTGLHDPHVHSLIAKLRFGDESFHELTWLGRSVVPPLVKWVDAENVDLAFVTRGVLTLCEIGGPEVEAWLGRVHETYSPLKRRAVLRGAPKIHRGSPLAKAMMPFANDPDRSVLLDVLESGDEIFSKVRILELSEHEDAEIREAAQGKLDEWFSLLGDDSIELRRKLMALMRKRPDDFREYFSGKVASNVFHLATSHEERELFLDALTLEGPPKTFRMFPESVQPREHEQSILRVAKALGPVEGRPNKAQSLLIEFFRRCTSSWDASSIPATLELVDLGYGTNANLTGFYHKHARSQDWPAIIARVERFSNSSLFHKFDAEPTPELFPPLRDLFVSLAEKKVESAGQGHNPAGHRDQFAMVVAQQLIRLDTERSLVWLCDYLAGPFWSTEAGSEYVFKMILEQVMDKDTPATRAGLRRLAGASRTGDDYQLRRGTVLEHLVKIGDMDCVDVWRKLCPRGGEVNPGARYAIARIAGRFGTSSQSTVTHHLSRGRPARKVDVETAAAVLDVYLSRCTAEGWSDVRGLFGSRKAPIVEVLLTHIDRAPAESRRKVLREAYNWTKTPIVRERILAGLTDEDAEVRRISTAMLEQQFEPTPEMLDRITPRLKDSDTHVVRYAIDYINDMHDESVVGVVQPLLSHESALVRKRAFAAVVSLDPKRRVDYALQMKDDTLESNRKKVCEIALDTLDRRLVPVMIDYLRSWETRKSAKDALDAIRYYHDEKTRWERVLRGAGLGANNAAEALVNQALDKKDKKIRLVAIRSLGTLGVAETLPILIKLMQDGDAEIAKAAGDAVEKINGAGK